ncbi:MAG: NAD-dependent dehydratase [Duganella sp.]
MKLIIVGATGLVGRHLLTLALADARVSTVVAPVRRPLPAHPKLLAPLVDFDSLPGDAHWWQADAILCTLGTTIKAAGSKAAFRRVDFDYPLAAAKLAHAHGTPVYVLTSAIGANPNARVFYNRTKGELEQALQGVGFTSCTCVRPGLIGGTRDEFRPGERALQYVLGALSWLLPKRWRPNPPERIAMAMLTAALAPPVGFHAISSDEI